MKIAMIVAGAVIFLFGLIAPLLGDTLSAALLIVGTLVFCTGWLGVWIDAVLKREQLAQRDTWDEKISQLAAANRTRGKQL